MTGLSRSPGRVALVHDWLNGMRGGEKVFEVLCELFPDATVFTLFYEPERVSETIRRMKVVESSLVRVPGARRHYRALLPLLPRAVERFPTTDFDLVISTSHCVAKGVRPPRRGLHVCYCFTPMRYIWDQFDSYFPVRDGWKTWKRHIPGKQSIELKSSLMGQLKRQAMTAIRPCLQKWDRETAQRVDAFLADSENVARKIRRYYGREARVVYPPVDTEFFTPVPGTGSRTRAKASPDDSDAPYLVASALVPYKRIDRAIGAVQRLGRRLVVIGEGPERKRLQAMAGPTVEFRGWVTNDELRDAYRRARALLYPGEEDFGITALEAQACGTPVVALGRGGALETVVKGKTGLFFPEPLEASLAAALQQFETRRFDPADCRAQAERFRRPLFRDNLKRELQQYFDVLH